jgi:long-chain acyl-CoA synthetase
MEEIKKEVMNYVNAKVNRFSRITAVIEEEKEFEKTPSKKIRRFLYTNKESDKNIK